MGRIYSATGENLTITSTSPLFQMMTISTETSAGGSVKIKRIEISQRGTATAAQVGFLAGVRLSPGSTFTLTSVSPVPLNYGTPSSAFAGGTAGTTAGSIGVAATVDGTATTGTGSYTSFYNWNFCNLNGLIWIATPGEEIVMPASGNALGNFVIKPTAVPGTLTGWTFTVVWEEF